MPTELLSALPRAIELLNQAGVPGLLLLAVIWLIKERLRHIRQGARASRQRDKQRALKERYFARLQAEGIVVDVSDIDKEFERDEDED